MILILTIILFGVSIDKLCQGQMDQHGNPKYEASVPLYNLMSMTGELVRDATEKFEYSKKIQLRYVDSTNYELGMAIANMIETYKKMLKLYRTYGNITCLHENTYDYEAMLNAFHIMQGYYNELRIEIDIYYIALERHRQVLEAVKKKKRPSRRMSEVTRSLKVDHKDKQLNNKENFKQTLRQGTSHKKMNNVNLELDGFDIELDDWK